MTNCRPGEGGHDVEDEDLPRNTSRLSQCVWKGSEQPPLQYNIIKI